MNRYIKETLVDFFCVDRKTFLSVLLLSLLGVMTEGIGLLLILPLLGLLGMGNTQGGEGIQYLSQVLENLAIPRELNVVLVLFIGIFTVRLIIVYLRSLQITKLRLVFGRYLFHRIWRMLVHSEWSALATKRRSDFMHSLSVEVQRLSNGLGEFLRLLSSMILMLVYVGFAFQLSWQLTLLVVVMGGGIFCVTTRKRAKSLQAGRDVLGYGRKTSHIMVQYLEGLGYAKANGIEDKLTEEFMSRHDATLEAQQNYQEAVAGSSFLSQWLSAVGLVVFLWLGVQVFELGFATLLVMVIILSRLLPVWSTIERNLHALLHVLPTCQYLFIQERELLGHVRNGGAQETTEVQRAKALVHIEKALELQNVSMSYAGEAANDALCNLSMKIPAHQITVVMGASGAGKTSLADVVAGLQPASSGSVSIDGVDFTNLDKPAWRQSIAYMPQENFLLDATIAENLRWHNPDCAPNDMNEALEATGAMSFLRRHTDPLMFAVGQNGRNLSGGERQRVLLACMLVRKPQLLILDEVTNALDQKNQKLIFDCLVKVKATTTVLMISHSSEALTIADQTIYLEDGQVTSPHVQRRFL